MQVHRIQNNNPYIAFRSNKMITNLQIDNKNSLITEEVRNIANGLNKFFNSVTGKTLTIDGLSVGKPIETSLEVTLCDNNADQNKVKLYLSKNIKEVEQISSAQLYITKKNSPTQIIEYYPKKQINGVWMDDLLSYNACESFFGEEYYNYSRNFKLNDIFAKYGKEFLSKLEKLAKYYK